MDLAQLGLEIRSDGVVVATDRLNKFGEEAGRAGKATDLLLKAFGALAAVFSVTKLIQYTNTWTDLNSRIEIATGSMGRGTATMERLDQMARRTYSSLELTAESFLRNATAMRDLGYSTGETLDFVESINNALVVSGAKGERAESVMNALGKAMALGKLSGDELNTVIGSGGRIAEALADSLGVTTLELRKLGAEGKLTGTAIYDGLTGQLEMLREEADGMAYTIGDASVLMGNAVLSVVGRFDEWSGASQHVATGIIWLADNLEAFAPIVSGLAAVLFVALLPAIGAATAATWTFTAALLANPLTWVALAVGAVVAAAVLLIQRMGGVQEAFLTVQSVALDVWERVKSGGQSLADVMSGVALMIQGAFTRAWGSIAEGFANLVTSMGSAAGMLGLDGAGATAFAKSLHTQAAAYEAGSQISFGNAATNWGKATGPGAQMNNVGVGASWEGMNGMFGPGADLDAGGGGGAGGGAAGTAAKADAYERLTKTILENIAVMQVEAETIGMTEYQATKLATAQELLRAAAETGRPITASLIEDINALAQQYADAELTVAGLHMTMENRSPWEVMGEEILRLNELMEKGKIGAATYWAEVGKSAERTAGVYASAASGILGQASKLTEGLASEGEAAFNIQKAISIANAIVSGGEAVVKSYNWGSTFGGPIGGGIAAGLAAAATAAQIGMIASTSYQSKSPVSAGGGGSGSAAMIQNAPQRQQSQSAPAPIDVTLRGLDRNALYDGETVEKLIQLFEERSSDGRQFKFKVA